MMHSTPTIVTGAERSVAQLRRIFERADAPVDVDVDVRMPAEPVPIEEPVVAVEPVSEPEYALEWTLQPTLGLKHETETEVAVAFDMAIEYDSEYEDTRVHAHETELVSIVVDGGGASAGDDDDECPKTQEPLDSTSETGSDSWSDVAVAPMPKPILRQESNASKTQSLLRLPRLTRSAPRVGSALSPTPAPEVRATPRTMRDAKSNEKELARARAWRDNKKALDSRVAAAKPRYLEYATSSRYIAHREASVAQRQQSARTNGTTRATTTRHSSA